MKNIIEARNTANTASHIIKKNPLTHKKEKINIKATMLVASKLIDGEAPGNSENFKVLSFNINSLLDHLETRDKLTRYK